MLAWTLLEIVRGTRAKPSNPVRHFIFHDGLNDFIPFDRFFAWLFPMSTFSAERVDVGNIILGPSVHLSGRGPLPRCTVLGEEPQYVLTKIGFRLSLHRAQLALSTGCKCIDYFSPELLVLAQRSVGKAGENSLDNYRQCDGDNNAHGPQLFITCDMVEDLLEVRNTSAFDVQ